MTVLHNDKDVSWRKQLVSDRLWSITIRSRQMYWHLVLQIESSNRIAQGPRHKSVIVFRTKESMHPLYRSMESTDFCSSNEGLRNRFRCVRDCVEQFYQVDEYELIIPFGHRACCHIIHYFKETGGSLSTNGGWAEHPAPVFGR
jgi:hypothetical protein